MNNYIILILMNGLEIIGKDPSGTGYLAGSDSRIILENPAVVMTEPNETGNLRLTLVPYVPYVQSVSYPATSVGIAIPPQNIVDRYKQLFEPDAIYVPTKEIIKPN